MPCLTDAAPVGQTPTSFGGTQRYSPNGPNHNNTTITTIDGNVDQPELVRVFVVEDSPVIRASLTQRIVDDLRFTVVGYADTAKGAIEALMKELPDLLILDLHLKQGTGYDILAYLRKAGAPPELKTIVLTNYASPMHRRRALELGAGDFFDKSMQFDDMLDALRLWADGKGQKRPSANGQ